MTSTPVDRSPSLLRIAIWWVSMVFMTLVIPVAFVGALATGRRWSLLAMVPVAYVLCRFVLRSEWRHWREMLPAEADGSDSPGPGQGTSPRGPRTG